MSANPHDRTLFFGIQSSIPLLRKQILEEKAHFIRIIIEQIQEAKQKESKDNQEKAAIESDIAQYLKMLNHALTIDANCDFFITQADLHENPKIKDLLSSSRNKIYQLIAKLKKEQAPSFLSRHTVPLEFKALVVSASLTTACIATAMILATFSAYWWLLPIGSVFGVFAVCFLVGSLHNFFRGDGFIFSANILKKYNFSPESNDIQLKNNQDQTELISLVAKRLLSTVKPVKELPEVLQKMNPQNWPKGYPVEPSELVFIKLLYWGFDEKDHVGELIMHRELAQDILEIFLELHLNHFPIESIRPIYEFNNNDDRSMEANNASAFNCREVTGQPGIFSQHAYGRAVDINPKINPYVKQSKNLVLPESSRVHVDRNTPEKGKITKDGLLHRLFTQRGWDWGGDWRDIQDYQHFEKRANGEKRDPDGYSNISAPKK